MGNRARGIVVLLLVCHTLGALDPTVLSSMETAEARLALRDTVLEGDIGRVVRFRFAPVYQRLYNTTVLVSAQTRGQTVEITFRLDRPRTERGAFVLTRSLRGELLEIRLRTRDDAGSYLVARALGERSTLDVYHLDATTPLYRDVIVPVRFEDLAVSSLERIVALTRSKIDWDFLLAGGSGEDDARVQRLAAAIRSRLGGLRDADDGAIDERGRYVAIETLEPQSGAGGLNCSGFVKWVIDGFYYPLTGRNTSVALARETPDVERGGSAARTHYYLDPWFGLDWNRNLARLLDIARGGPTGRGLGAHDVTSVERMTYTEDLGYPVADLGLLLYTLAVRDPGHLYLASVNGVLDEEVGLRQSYHTLALLPYIDAGGRFGVAVFERIVESSLPSVLRRYDGHQIHLVRVDTLGVFDPLDLP